MSGPFAALSPQARDRLAAMPAARAAVVDHFLTGLLARGCTVKVPSAVRTDYLQLDGPPGLLRGRLASLHVRSGRVEFQNRTWFLAQELSLAGLFRHVPAENRCSIDLDTAENRDAAAALAAAILAGRLGA